MTSSTEAVIRAFPDVSKLVDDMIQAAWTILKKDITTIGSFTKRQLTGMAELAELAEMITVGTINRTIRDNSRDYHLGRLKSKPDEFIEAFKGMIEVEIEKVWNAMIGALWKAIETAAGIKLPSLA